jgi:hypothetical protein
VTGDRREDGAAVVEFAIVASLFLLLLWGLLVYGAVFATKQALAHAASEAAIAAAGAEDDQLDASARQVIAAQLEWLGHFGFDAADEQMARIVTEPCQDAPEVPCIRVQLTHDWASNPVIPSIASVVTPDTLTEYAVVKAWE